MPPTRKNRKAVTPYRMPIRLWSTVEIQLQKPCSAFGRANGRAGARVTATAIRSLLQSFERREERHELVDLRVREGELWHPRTLLGPHGLHGRRVLDPLVQVLGGDVERGPGE